MNSGLTSKVGGGDILCRGRRDFSGVRFRTWVSNLILVHYIKLHGLLYTIILLWLVLPVLVLFVLFVRLVAVAATTLVAQSTKSAQPPAPESSPRQTTL